MGNMTYRMHGSEYAPDCQQQGGVFAFEKSACHVTRTDDLDRQLIVESVKLVHFQPGPTTTASPYGIVRIGDEDADYPVVVCQCKSAKMGGTGDGRGVLTTTTTTISLTLPSGAYA